MKKILIIEDDKYIRELYQELLAELYDLDFAVTGREGFRRAAGTEYDLVIADLRMPNWSGAESIAAIDMINPDKKYIVVSGYLEDKEFVEILKTIPSIVAYMKKPVIVDELLETIETALVE
ncbi:response regulator [Planctomycetota bacterium]